MNRKAIFVVAMVLSSVATAWSQMAPKPGPEVKKLDYFVGTWTTEATIPQGPWGMGGKFSSTETSEWMDGNFFVVSHSDFKMPPELGGDGKETSIMGYDTQENVYIYEAFNSQGHHESSKGTLTGDTWTWTSEANYGGQDIKQRSTIKILSPTSFSIKFEASMDGTNWMTFMEGKATKK
jgi:hypothetical protein